jgi:3'(2'), 5'-bisphosphate nucleotidase
MRLRVSISQSDRGLIDALTTVLSKAAAVILVVRKGALDTRMKADRSPVTAADEASETTILAGLGEVLPGVSVVSEEAFGRSPPQLDGNNFVLVDPLDGTREFIAGSDEFCINLAVVTDGRPRLGIIAAPALGMLWRTTAGGGAERLELAPGEPAANARKITPIRPRTWPELDAAAAVSRSHLDPKTEAFLQDLKITRKIPSGSAIKLCRIAEGIVDVYPRLAPVSEWDVAAGDAIITSAGGAVSTPGGEPLAYGRSDQRFIVPGFVAFGDQKASSRLLRSA